MLMFGEGIVAMFVVYGASALLILGLHLATRGTRAELGGLRFAKAPARG